MVQIDHTLDCKGLSCPMPIVKLNATIKKIEVGQVLEMIGTDPGSKKDVPLWCKRTGNELLETIDESGVFRFIIQRKK
jgi:tRNA 2-thiouridine synthesizing protein A